MMLFYQLRNELWKLFGKKRTYIGFGMFLIVQAAIVLLMRFGPPHRQMVRQMQRGAIDIQPYLTNLTIATGALLAMAYILVPLYVALIGGDLVAKEAEDGTLRMILSRPVSRFRLLMLKWASGVVFGAVLVAVFGLFGPLFARLFYPSGGLYVMGRMGGGGGGPVLFDGWTGWEHYALAHAALMLKAATIMSLAFMWSCFNIKPAAATVLAISVVFISMIVQGLPFLEDLKQWFITYHLNLWTGFLQQPTPWADIWKSAGVLAGYNLAFLAIGCWVFQRRDIKS